MTPKEVFGKVADLLADPERWTKNAYARNADGEEVKETDGGAVCFCSIGAIRAVMAGEHTQAQAAIRYYATKQLQNYAPILPKLYAHGLRRVGLIPFNDVLAEHEDVVAFFRHLQDSCEMSMDQLRTALYYGE